MKILTILMLLSLMFLVVSCATETVEEETVTETQEVEGSDTAVVEASAGVYQVAIENFKFKPTDLKVKVGETVEWINKDYSSYTQEIDDMQEKEKEGLQEGIQHTVTFESIGSDIHLPVGGTATVTFTGPGTFRYFCQYHPSMQGTVTVS